MHAYCWWWHPPTCRWCPTSPYIWWRLTINNGDNDWLVIGYCWCWCLQLLVVLIGRMWKWERIRCKEKRKEKVPLWGIFTITVPLFYHMIQGLCFCYLPNIKSKWNKFKWKMFNNSNYDNFHGGGVFSHAYVIMHKYFGKKPKMKKKKKKKYISFYIQLNMLFWMKISCTFCQHLGPQILSLVNTKNQPNGKKMNHFPCCFFKMNFVAFKILISYII